MNYQTFAKLYDDLFDEDAYADWFQYATKFIKNKDGKLLELAGGAGRLAIQLKKAGYEDVTVFDLSTEMLALAAQHAQEADMMLPLIEGDMREWSDYEQKFATITSFADSFNYLAFHLGRQTCTIRGICTIGMMMKPPLCGHHMVLKSKPTR